MEVENSVFGFDAENADKFDSEEKFNFYHNDKEEALNCIKKSSEDLTDFVESLIQDVPDPSEDEVRHGIERILERAYPDTQECEETKRSKKKVTFKVLFIAALLSVLSFSCLFAVGSKHKISIENGFVTFAKDTVKIVFFGETEDEYINVDALLTDLKYRGFSDILFPGEFIDNADEYKVSVPEHSQSDGSFEGQVSFDIYNGTYLYSFTVTEGFDSSNSSYSFPDLEAAETIVVDDLYIYIFEFDNGFSVIQFVNNGIRYSIDSKAPLLEMIRIANTIAKAE